MTTLPDAAWLAKHCLRYGFVDDLQYADGKGWEFPMIDIDRNGKTIRYWFPVAVVREALQIVRGMVAFHESVNS